MKKVFYARKEVINISEQLISKRMVDIDDLLDFLLNKRELIIGDDYYRERFNEDLTEAFKEYASMTVPDVEIGQTVWVIREKYNLDTQKIEHTKSLSVKFTRKLLRRNTLFRYVGQVIILVRLRKTVLVRQFSSVKRTLKII